MQRIYITHTTPSAAGPGARPHGHIASVRFRVSQRIDPTTGMVRPAEVFKKDCLALLHDLAEPLKMGVLGDILQKADPTPEWPHINLDHLPGIRSTMENFLLFLEERMRPIYPTIVLELTWGGGRGEEFLVSTDV
jgi:hypothetical protein